MSQILKLSLLVVVVNVSQGSDKPNLRTTYDAFKDRTTFIYQSGGVEVGGLRVDLICPGHQDQCRPASITLSPWTLYDTDPSAEYHRAPHSSAAPLEILVDSTVRYRLDPKSYSDVVSIYTVHVEHSYAEIPVEDFERISRAQSMAYRWGSDERQLSAASIAGLGALAKHISPAPVSSSPVVAAGIVGLIALVALGVGLKVRSRRALNQSGS